jgi:hypothetical protein
MVGAAGGTLLNRASAQRGHKRNKAAKTNEISATMQAPLITRSAIFSIAGDRANVPIAAKTAVSMHAMATRRKNTSIAVSDGSPAEPIGRTMPPARILWHICCRVQAQRDLVQPARRSNAPPSLGWRYNKFTRAPKVSREVCRWQ